MEDYIDSLEEIKEIWKAERNDDLIKVEMKKLRKRQVNIVGLQIAHTQI